jgi:hypothetical protein
LWTPYLFCREIHFLWMQYMLSIYTRPVLTALPVAALLLSLKVFLLRGDHWLELIAAALISALAYLPAAWFVCVQHDHRQLIVRQIVENRFARILFPRAGRLSGNQRPSRKADNGQA